MKKPDAMPEALNGLFESERLAPGVPEEARRRVRSRLARSFASDSSPLARPAKWLPAGKVIVLAAMAATAVSLFRQYHAIEPSLPSLAAPAPASSFSVSVAAEPIKKTRPLDTLSRERALLDAARENLDTRSLGSAAVALDNYARRFPDGQLREEYSALQIERLLLSGDRAGAQSAIRLFDATYPESIFRAALHRTMK